MPHKAQEPSKRDRKGLELCPPLDMTGLQTDPRQLWLPDKIKPAKVWSVLSFKKSSLREKDAMRQNSLGGVFIGGKGM